MKRTILMTVVVVIILVVGGVIAAEFLSNQKSASSPVLTFNSKAQVGSYVTEYPTQSGNTGPNGITVDSHGIVWFVLGNRSVLAQLNPLNGTLHEYPIPGAGSSSSLSWGMTVQDSKSLVWFTEENSNAVWSFSESTRTFTKYSLQDQNAYPFGITIDGQGNVWFTESGANKLGEISSSGILSETHIPSTASGSAAGIATDGSGKVWIALPNIDEIASYMGGKFQFYNLTGLAVLPAAIAVDQHGSLWITQHGPSLITEFNPNTHYFKTISTSIPPLGSSLPYFDYVDAKGNVWFNEHYGNAIACFSPESQTLIEYQVTTRLAGVGNISGMLTMNLSPDDMPWFTEIFSGKVGTVDISKAVSLSVGITNSSLTLEKPMRIPNGSSITLSLSIKNGIQTQRANLIASVGNASTYDNFQFSFLPSYHSGNFNDTLTILNRGSKSGVYFVTIGASVADVVVSTIIEVVVP